MDAGHRSCSRAPRLGARRRSATLLALALVASVLAFVGVVALPAPVGAVGAPPTQELAVGASHACGITAAGSAMCWGLAANGQLGNNSTIASTTPVPVSGLTSGVTAVAAGTNHSCGVVSGAAWCWGGDGNGQLGNNTTGVRFVVPVQVSGLTSGVTAIATGQNFSCAVVSGGVWCWGTNANGQLGNNSTTQSLVPVQVSGLTSGATAVTAGQNSACAIVSGAAWCWGNNSAGQLGDGTTTQSLVPVQVSGLTSGVTGIATALGPGQPYSCAVVSGAARCWGNNTNGQLGTGTNTASLVPVQVTGLTAGVTRITTAFGHACALVSGAPTCWGLNTSGQLGNNTATSSLVPVSVSGIASGAVAIAAGGSVTCAIVSNVAKCWGASNQGQLGNPFFPLQSPIPQQVYGLTSGVTDTANGANPGALTCAVVSGSARCWGSGTFGQLGNGASVNSPYPVQVSGLTSGVTSIATGTAHGCALVSGAVWCWGDNSLGQLGNGTNTTSNVPVQVSALGSNVTAIAAGYTGTCALVSGAAWCWGANAGGTLGNGTTTQSNVPVQVSGLTSGVSSIAVGTDHACAIVSDGAQCWGNNTNGQLGDGTNTKSLVPVQVSGLTSGVTTITAGLSSTCAIVSGGTRCWGTNSAGQLGDNSITKSNVPVSLSGLTGITAIAAGYTNVCAVVSGAARCWGANTLGQLGDGTNTMSYSPVQVSGLTTGVTDVSVGNASSCAIVSGRATCWGSSAAIGATTWEPMTVTGGITWAGSTGSTAPVAADLPLSAPRGVGAHVVLSATDAESDPLTYSVVAQPAKGTLDCNGSAGEDCTYTAGAGQSGSDSFTYKANDGTADSNVATVSITITNQAPTGDAIAASAPRGVATPITLTGADPNSDPITFAKATDPSKGAVSCSTAGACTYTANAGTTGSDSFTYTVSDGSLTSSTATVTITITNTAPSADDRALTVTKGVPTAVTLSGSDPNGDPLTFAVTTNPTKGSVTCGGADGSSCTYTAGANQAGTDTIKYKANDGDKLSPVAVVTITVANGAPAANPQALEAARGVATPITLTGSDADLDTSSFTVATQPTKGTVTCGGADGSACSYTASAGSTGTDTFTFKANDGNADSAPATVTITITNQAPIANAQTVAGNAPTTSTPITLTGSDPNGDALTYQVMSQPTKGVLSCTGPTCSYVASAGRTGLDTFTFKVTDIESLSSTVATIRINLDNTTPGVFLGGNDFLEPETDSPARGPAVPVTLTTPAAVPLTIWYYTTNGSATARVGPTGGDFLQWGTLASPRSITVPVGKVQALLSPPVLSDSLVEADETFAVHILSVTGGAAYLGPADRNVQIIDSDSIGATDPILSVVGTEIVEGNAPGHKLQFKVLLSRPSAVPVTFTYATSNHTAIAGVDYTAKSGTLTLDPGEVSASIDVPVTANTSVQAAQRVMKLTVTLVGSPPVYVYSDTGLGTIVDDD